MISYTIKVTWKRLCNVRKNDIERARDKVKTGISGERKEDSSCVSAQRMRSAPQTCPNLFSMMEVVPLYGNPISILWPLGGMSLGAVANLCFKAGFSPEQQRYWKGRALRVAGPAAGLAGLACLAASVRSVPETGRWAFTVRWPWMNEEAVADLDPVFEDFLDTKVTAATAGKTKWVSGVMSKLKAGNPEIGEREWKIKVIDESLAMLLCFVVPRSSNIWMSAHYLRLVEDDPQLAYVLGHELSHVICRHAKDFCFIETTREAVLLAAGLALGWTMTDAAPTDASRWKRFSRFAKFFAVCGVSCVGFAVCLNLCFALPYRRMLELEADECGLRYAAKACYRLKSIPGHWDTLSFTGAMPEWRSTHPTAMVRKANLLSLLSEADGIRSDSGCRQ